MRDILISIYSAGKYYTFIVPGTVENGRGKISEQVFQDCLNAVGLARSGARIAIW